MRCWDGHNTPDEMHRSSGEGSRDHGGGAEEPGGGAESTERQGHKAWQQVGAGPTMSLCPACPQALAYAPVEQIKVVQVLFVLGGLFSGRWSKDGISHHFLRSSSQCHTTYNK